MAPVNTAPKSVTRHEIRPEPWPAGFKPGNLASHCVQMNPERAARHGASPLQAMQRRVLRCARTAPTGNAAAVPEDFVLEVTAC
jgi:hypothetical protein